MEDVPPDISNLGPHFTESPFFIIGVIIAVIALGVLLRMLFNKDSNEYTHNPDE